MLALNNLINKLYFFIVFINMVINITQLETLPTQSSWVVGWVGGGTGHYVVTPTRVEV